MRDGELDGKAQEFKEQKPPCFRRQSQPQIV